MWSIQTHVTCGEKWYFIFAVMNSVTILAMGPVEHLPFNRVHEFIKPQNEYVKWQVTGMCFSKIQLQIKEHDCCIKNSESWSLVSNYNWMCPPPFVHLSGCKAASIEEHSGIRPLMEQNCSKSLELVDSRHKGTVTLGSLIWKFTL